MGQVVRGQKEEREKFKGQMINSTNKVRKYMKECNSEK